MRVTITDGPVYMCDRGGGGRGGYGLRITISVVTCVSQEGGGGEGADSEAPSLLSYTIGYVSLADLGNVFACIFCFYFF